MTVSSFLFQSGRKESLPVSFLRKGADYPHRSLPVLQSLSQSSGKDWLKRKSVDQVQNYNAKGSTIKSNRCNGWKLKNVLTLSSLAQFKIGLLPWTEVLCLFSHSLATCTTHVSIPQGALLEISVCLPELPITYLPLASPFPQGSKSRSPSSLLWNELWTLIGEIFQISPSLHHSFPSAAYTSGLALHGTGNGFSFSHGLTDAFAVSVFLAKPVSVNYLLFWSLFFSLIPALHQMLLQKGILKKHLKWDFQLGKMIWTIFGMRCDNQVNKNQAQKITDGIEVWKGEKVCNASILQNWRTGEVGSILYLDLWCPPF